MVGRFEREGTIAWRRIHLGQHKLMPRYTLESGVRVHGRMQEAEAGRLLVEGQPELHNETISKQKEMQFLDTCPFHTNLHITPFLEDSQ